MILNYRGNTLELQSGDIVLLRDNFMLKDPMTILSAAIRFFTRSYYNHVALIVEKDGELYINEAVAKGIISRPLQGHLDREKCEIAILRPKAIAKSNFDPKRAMSKVGTPYDFYDLIIAQVIYRITGIWIGLKRHSAERCMVCAEYAAWSFDLPGWWYYSSKELLLSNLFETYFYEKESGVTQPAYPISGR